MKSNWISSFGAPDGGKLICSVLGMLGLILLPESFYGMQLSHFRCIASVSLGHQKCFADGVILLMAGCPLCNEHMTVVRRLSGTMILSSKNTSP